VTIAPIVQSVTVGVPPARAFELFTRRIGDWWERGKSIAANPQAEVVMEPGVGGRLFERDADGAETLWGDVLVWDPPRRLVFAWRITAEFKYDPDFETEVELRFDAADDGSTLVSLEHRNLERYGPSAERMSQRLAGGWPSLLRHYAELTQKESAR